MRLVRGRDTGARSGRAFPFFENLPDQERLGINPHRHLPGIHFFAAGCVRVARPSKEAITTTSSNFFRAIQLHVSKIVEIASPIRITRQRSANQVKTQKESGSRSRRSCTLLSRLTQLHITLGVVMAVMAQSIWRALSKMMTRK